MPALDRLQIRGFKSIRETDLELRPLNVLIGANGAGKSNLIGVFELLHSLVQERLQLHVAKAGGADSILHFGRRVTEDVKLRFRFGSNAYQCELIPTTKDSLVFATETLYFQGSRYAWEDALDHDLGAGHSESRIHDEIRNERQGAGIARHVLPDDYALGELWEKNVLGGRPGG